LFTYSSELVTFILNICFCLDELYDYKSLSFTDILQPFGPALHL